MVGRKSSSAGSDGVPGGMGLEGLERKTTELDEPSQSDERASAVEEDDDDEKEPGKELTADEPSSVLADAAENYTSNHLTVRDKKKIMIEADQAPSRRLLLKMVDLQEHLHRVTQRIMSGMAVSEEDWEHARSLGRRFGTMMTDDVAFAWEAVIAEGDEGEESSELLGTKTDI
mmetsp:Transcript_25264/g.58079  ORF Transcript_25264/g.58079 Transcript_25264/m.58079 type:complete len:173 (-) Transcript_25264:179-697(-)